MTAPVIHAQVESDDFLNETASALYGSFSEISQALTALVGFGLAWYPLA